MTPVTQTRTGPVNGNCLSACIASILEIPLEVIPDFDAKGNQWLHQLAEFLLEYDLYYLQIPADDPIVEVMFQHGHGFTGDLWHTIQGISPRGGPHACVGLDGQLVWDPHPIDGTGRGLKKIETFGLLGARCNPAFNR